MVLSKAGGVCRIIALLLATHEAPMKRHVCSSFGILAAAMVTMSAPVLAQSADAGHRSGRYTVVFRSATLPADAEARVAAAGGRLQQRVDQIGVLTASGDAAFADRLAKNN